MGDHTVTMKLTATQTGTVDGTFGGIIDNHLQYPGKKNSLQVMGTFSGSSLKPQITLDGTTYQQAKDSSGAAVTVTAATLVNLDICTPYPVRLRVTRGGTPTVKATITAIMY